MKAVILYGQRGRKSCEFYACIPLTLLQISQKTLKKLAKRFNVTTIEELFRLGQRKIVKLQNKKIQAEIFRIKSKIASRIQRIKTSRSEYKQLGIFDLCVYALEKLFIPTIKISGILNFLHREKSLKLSDFFILNLLKKTPRGTTASPI